MKSKLVMDNKIDRIKVILSIVLVIVLLFTVIYKYGDLRGGKTEVSTDALKFKEEYEKLNDEVNENNGKIYPKLEIAKDNKIKYSDFDEVIDIIKNKTGVIYLGYPKCPWCRNAVPVLLQVAADSEIGNIYYINMYEERDSYVINDDDELVLDKEGSSGYKKLLEALDSELDEYTLENSKGEKISTGEKRIYVPLVIFVKDGQVLATYGDTVDSQKDPYVLLNDDQKEELYDIYMGYMHEVLDDLCDDKC